jgi:ribose 5-phosphate isomerase B
MRLALGADHAGVGLKRDVKRFLDELRIDYVDFGTNGEDSVDYPDFAELVADGVARGAFDRGILICGTGIGMAIAANKVRGVRAAPVTDLESARLAREHNDANVLALGARILPRERALELVRAFLDTPFAGGRHARRIRKITALEQPQEQDTDQDLSPR